MRAQERRRREREAPRQSSNGQIDIGQITTMLMSLTSMFNSGKLNMKMVAETISGLTQGSQKPTKKKVKKFGREMKIKDKIGNNLLRAGEIMEASNLQRQGESQR